MTSTRAGGAEARDCGRIRTYAANAMRFLDAPLNHSGTQSIEKKREGGTEAWVGARATASADGAPEYLQLGAWAPVVL